MTEKLKIAGVLAFIFVAYGLAGHFDEIDAKEQDEHYCQMREIWEQNKDVLPVKRPGWPNFKPEIVCGV